MLVTIERELKKLAARTKADVLAVTDASGTILAVAGQQKEDWPLNRRITERGERAGAKWVMLPTGVFQFAQSLLTLQDTAIGTLQLAKKLDQRYAEEIAALSGAATVIASNDKVIASTLPPSLEQAPQHARHPALASVKRRDRSRLLGVRRQAAFPGRGCRRLRARFD